MTYDETALEWYQRVQHTKRRLLENPIVFFSDVQTRQLDTQQLATQQSASHLQNASSAEGNDSDVQLSSIPLDTIRDDESRFIVTAENVKNMAAATFFGEVNLRNEIEMRLHQWRHRQSQRKNHHGNLVNSNYRSHVVGGVEQLEDALLASFPSGSGLPFIDEVLAHGIKSQPPRNSSLEISGKAGGVTTQVLIALAANYVAAISNMITFNDTNDSNDTNMHHQGTSTSSSSLPPMVVILDPEHNVQLPQLAHAVYTAVMRRFYATSNFRQIFHQEQHRHELERRTKDNQGQSTIENHHSHIPNLSLKEKEMEDEIIEREFIRALGQIQIVHPKDAANGYISALEILIRTLNHRSSGGIGKDDLAASSSQLPTTSLSPLQTTNLKLQPAPTMLLMDSVLSAFEPTSRLYESLPNSTGLSGRNEFIRQLKSLRSKHDIFLASTNCLRGSKSSFRATNRLTTFNSFEPWNKFISHRLTLEYVAQGSKEEREGFKFVAVVNTKAGQVFKKPFLVHDGVLSFTTPFTS